MIFGTTWFACKCTEQILKIPENRFIAFQPKVLKLGLLLPWVIILRFSLEIWEILFSTDLMGPENTKQIYGLKFLLLAPNRAIVMYCLCISVSYYTVTGLFGCTKVGYYIHLRNRKYFFVVGKRLKFTVTNLGWHVMVSSVYLCLLNQKIW